MKSSGSDSIPTIVLKELSNEIAPLLKMIFRCSATTGQVPEDWKKANVASVLSRIQKG